MHWTVAYLSIFFFIKVMNCARISDYNLILIFLGQIYGH